MRPMIMSLVLLFACAQEEPNEAQITAATTGTWVLPLGGAAWKIGFNIVNPTVPGNSTCFGKPLAQLVHAGEDWGNSAGTPVRAIGAGTVVFSQFFNYPGWVVVIRHDLSSAERSALGITETSIYSQYGHLNSAFVSAGAVVSAGQQIGSILDQGSNSHLHWEVRKVQTPQLCSFTIPGPGYTNSGTDARNFGYMSPSGSVSKLQSATPTLPTCGSGLFCALNQIQGSTQCLSGSTAVFCCPSGQTIQNGICTPTCGTGLFCAANQIPGSSQCMSGSQLVFCCPSGQTIINGSCSG